jgi:hypothetical protein
MSQDAGEPKAPPRIPRWGLAAISAGFGAIIGGTLTPEASQIGERAGGVTGVGGGTFIGLAISVLVAATFAGIIYRKQ